MSDNLIIVTPQPPVQVIVGAPPTTTFVFGTDQAFTNAQIAGVVGGAASNRDTLKELSDAIDTKVGPADVSAALQAYDTALKAGADAAHDTFRELQDILVADESAAAALATLVGTKAAKGANTDITSLSGTSASPGVDLTFASTTLASSATVDLGTAPTVKVAISGTTTITSLGTKPHAYRMLRFSGSLTLTHNATSLILPGLANIVTAAGDTAIFTSDASGNWTCRHYQRAASDVALRSAGTGPGQVLLTDGLLTVLTALINQLPAVLPSSSGQLWNNGGVLSIS